MSKNILLNRLCRFAVRLWNCVFLHSAYLRLIRRIALAHPAERRAIDTLLESSPYLHTNGWIKSHETKTPVDERGKALPWLCYPAIHLLTQKLPQNVHVLEFGAGNSSRWWSSRAASILSIESDAEWFARVNRNKPANVDLRHVSSAELPSFLDTLVESGHKFDLVVIDNFDRGSVAIKTTGLLHGRSVVIFDNSDEPLYRPSVEHIKSFGFREIELHGPGPVNAYFWSTSFLYMDNNILGF